MCNINLWRSDSSLGNGRSSSFTCLCVHIRVACCPVRIYNAPHWLSHIGSSSACRWVERSAARRNNTFRLNEGLREDTHKAVYRLRYPHVSHLLVPLSSSYNHVVAKWTAYAGDSSRDNPLKNAWPSPIKNLNRWDQPFSTFWPSAGVTVCMASHETNWQVDSVNILNSGSFCGSRLSSEIFFLQSQFNLTTKF